MPPVLTSNLKWDTSVKFRVGRSPLPCPAGPGNPKGWRGAFFPGASLLAGTERGSAPIAARRFPALPASVVLREAPSPAPIFADFADFACDNQPRTDLCGLRVPFVAFVLNPTPHLGAVAPPARSTRSTRLKCLRASALKSPPGVARDRVSTRLRRRVRSSPSSGRGTARGRGGASSPSRGRGPFCPSRSASAGRSPPRAAPPAPPSSPPSSRA